MPSRSIAIPLLTLLCALGVARPAQPATVTVTVTGTGDTIAVDGSVTLREALASINGGANVNADVVAIGTYGSVDTIAFNILGGGPQTIAIGATALPPIVKPVIVNGYTQPGSSANTLAVGDNAVINIVVQGSAGGLNGLEVRAGGDNSVIRGLVLQKHLFAVQINASGVVVAGNFIGTDRGATTADATTTNSAGINIVNGNLGNAVIGGSAPADRNVISGNGSGVVMNSQLANTVSGNYIGVSGTGLAALPNTVVGVGIFVDSGVATIGGTPAGAGNTIANSGDTGVQVRIGSPGVHNASEAAILGNSITANATLGINNSANDVVTPDDTGDGDSGPNDLQNFPVITAAALGSGNVTVSGTLNSTAGTTFRVEIFSNATCNRFGFGEGATFLGAVDVTTDGSGNGAFGPAVLAISAGQTVITATATNPANHTSEFSSCVVAAGGPPPLPTLSINSVTANEGNAGTTPFTFTVTLSAASATPVTVSYATADGSATAAGNDYVPASGVLTFVPGGPLSQTITVNVVGDLAVEPNETFTVNLSAPSGATLAASQGTGTIDNDDSAGPPPPPAIPTLSTWGALLLIGLLAFLGLARLGR
ncbi:MAG TPA: Calx-beta domain-containing protein [Thermoanaerobaculia bacterium]|jgi:hypothetical protein|nr:Calx-beta domain-containing protein [Thermoanaerobaculia bacterium]